MQKLLSILIVFFAVFSTGHAATTVEKYNSPLGNNVFTSNTPVSMRLSGADGSYTLENSIGTQKTVSATGQTLELGKLALGFYTVKEGNDQTLCSFAVFPAAYRNSSNTRFCVDLAHGFRLSKLGKDRIKDWTEEAVGTLALAGVRYGRERVWVVGKTPEFNIESEYKDVFEQHKFLHETYKKNRIQNAIAFHQIPKWMQSDLPSVSKDLIHIYKMQGQYSSFFKNYIDTWEMWNENDIGFYKGTAYHYAAYLKTSYLASKRAAPNAHVSLSSIALDPGHMSDAIFANGINPYFDIYNYHTYVEATEHARVAAERVDYYFTKGGVRPIWKTETGVTFKNQKILEETGTYAEPDIRKGCNYMVRAMVNPTSMGVDKVFWFLGITSKNHHHTCPVDANNNATRLLSVLATINLLLEDGDYAGSLFSEKENHPIHVYKTSRGQTAVVWTNAEDVKEIVSLPVKGDAAVYAMTGELIKRYKNETITLTPSIEPVFVTAGSFDLNLMQRNAKLSTYKEEKVVKPSKVVIDLFFDNEKKLYDKNKHMLSIGPGSKSKGTMYVYNFSDRTYRGNLDVKLSDSSWKIQLPKKTLKINPMARAEVPFTLQAPKKAKGFNVSTLTITMDSGRSIAQVRLGIDRRALPPTAILDLSKGVTWHMNYNKSVAKAETGDKDGKRQVRITSKSPGNFWLTLEMIRKDVFDLAWYDAIKVTLNVTKVGNPGFLDLRCHEPNGAYYGMMDHPLKEGKLILWNFFSDLRWVPWSKHDGPDFHLDTSKITKLQFLLGPQSKGTKHDYAFEIESIEALKW